MAVWAGRVRQLGGRAEERANGLRRRERQGELVLPLSLSRHISPLSRFFSRDFTPFGSFPGSPRGKTETETVPSLPRLLVRRESRRVLGARARTKANGFASGSDNCPCKAALAISTFSPDFSSSSHSTLQFRPKPLQQRSACLVGDAQTDSPRIIRHPLPKRDNFSRFPDRICVWRLFVNLSLSSEAVPSLIECLAGAANGIRLSI